MTDYAIVTLIIRLANAVVWTLLLRRASRTQTRVPMVVLFVSVAGWWAFAIGSLTQFGLSGDVVRVMYTALAAAALITAAALLRRD